MHPRNAEWVCSGICIVVGTLSNGLISFLKVIAFGLGLFALIMFFVFLSRFVPFGNFGVIGEKIMLILFAVVAFGGPSIYKHLTKRSSPQKPINKRSNVPLQERTIDTDEGVVDLGLSVMWTDVSFPLNLTYRDVKVTNFSSHSFRLPSKEELDELITKCNWQKTYIDEEKFGFKIIGPNGKSIFLQSSYKKEKKVKGHFTTYPIYISIYFVDKGQTYIWKYSIWTKIPLPYIQTNQIILAADSNIGKIVVKNKKYENKQN